MPKESPKCSFLRGTISLPVSSQIKHHGAADRQADQYAIDMMRSGIEEVANNVERHLTVFLYRNIESEYETPRNEVDPAKSSEHLSAF